MIHAVRGKILPERAHICSCTTTIGKGQTQKAVKMSAIINGPLHKLSKGCHKGEIDMGAAE